MNADMKRNAKSGSYVVAATRLPITRGGQLFFQGTTSIMVSWAKRLNHILLVFIVFLSFFLSFFKQ